MTRPASLGGHAPAKAQPGTGSVEADFIEAYQDPRTRQWLGRVRLDGGRVLEGVRFGVPGSRRSAGSRPPLPATGERGIVLYPASARQIRLAYWICSVDNYTYGPDVSHPDDALSIHPSGQAQVTDRLGNHAWYYPNGDYVAQDGGDGGPAPAYRPFGLQVAERHNGTGDRHRPGLAATSAWKYDGRAGGRFFGAHLKDDWNQLWVNADASAWLARSFFASPGSTYEAIVHGEATGTRILAKSEYATPGDSGQALCDLHSGNGTVTLHAEKPTGSADLTLDAANNTITLTTKELIELVTHLIHLNAPLIRAGGNANTPVAMSDAVDRNFAKISVLLGLPMEPTASKSLLAEGLLP